MAARWNHGIGAADRGGASLALAGGAALGDRARRVERRAAHPRSISVCDMAGLFLLGPLEPKNRGAADFVGIPTCALRLSVFIDGYLGSEIDVPAAAAGAPRVVEAELRPLPSVAGVVLGAGGRDGERDVEVRLFKPKNLDDTNENGSWIVNTWTDPRGRFALRLPLGEPGNYAVEADWGAACARSPIRSSWGRSPGSRGSRSESRRAARSAGGSAPRRATSAECWCSRSRRRGLERGAARASRGRRCFLFGFDPARPGAPLRAAPSPMAAADDSNWLPHDLRRRPRPGARPRRSVASRRRGPRRLRPRNPTIHIPRSHGTGERAPRAVASRERGALRPRGAGALARVDRCEWLRARGPAPAREDLCRSRRRRRELDLADPHAARRRGRHRARPHDRRADPRGGIVAFGCGRQSRRAGSRSSFTTHPRASRTTFPKYASPMARGADAAPAAGEDPRGAARVRRRLGREPLGGRDGARLPSS